MKGKKNNLYTVLVLYVKNSVITKNCLLLFTFSDEAPRFLGEHDDDDDDNDHPISVPLTPSVLSRVREFNDEFTQALLRSTFNTFHSCAEVGILGVVSSLKIKNRSVLKRQKRDRSVLRRQKRFWGLFGPPGIAIGLVISKSRVITPIQKKI